MIRARDGAIWFGRDRRRHSGGRSLPLWQRGPRLCQRCSRAFRQRHSGVPGVDQNERTEPSRYGALASTRWRVFSATFCVRKPKGGSCLIRDRRHTIGVRVLQRPANFGERVEGRQTGLKPGDSSGRITHPATEGTTPPRAGARWGGPESFRMDVTLAGGADQPFGSLRVDCTKPVSSARESFPTSVTHAGYDDANVSSSAVLAFTGARQDKERHG